MYRCGGKEKMSEVQSESVSEFVVNIGAKRNYNSSYHHTESNFL